MPNGVGGRKWSFAQGFHKKRRSTWSNVSGACECPSLENVHRALARGRNSVFDLVERSLRPGRKFRFRLRLLRKKMCALKIHKTFVHAMGNFVHFYRHGRQAHDARWMPMLRALGNYRRGAWPLGPAPSGTLWRLAPLVMAGTRDRNLTAGGQKFVKIQGCIHGDATTHEWCVIDAETARHRLEHGARYKAGAAEKHMDARLPGRAERPRERPQVRCLLIL